MDTMKPDETTSTLSELQELGQSLESMWMDWTARCNQWATSWMTTPIIWWWMQPYWKPLEGASGMAILEKAEKAASSLPEQESSAPHSKEIAIEQQEPAQEQRPQPSEADREQAKRARRTAALECKTKAELYEYARQRGIEHRSQMTKAELVAALQST